MSNEIHKHEASVQKPIISQKTLLEAEKSKKPEAI